MVFRQDSNVMIMDGLVALPEIKRHKAHAE